MEGQRVELNAMTSDDFIAFVEDKLIEAGIRKVVPREKMLADAFRVFSREKRIEKAVEQAIKDMPGDTIDVPDDLIERVKEHLKENPASPWEDAVREIAISSIEVGEES